jgi:ketosteroid isomerase-like protein
MPHYRTVLMLTLAACCCVGCQKEPLDTRAQDERAIRGADAATLKAAQGNDVNGAVANYTDDADWLPPNALMVHGKTAIRAGWAKLIGSPGFTIDWQINRMEVARAGDLAYTVYVYQMAFNSDLAVKSPAKTPETKHQTIKHRPRKRHKTS